MSNDKKPLGRLALQKQPTLDPDPSLSIEALRALSEKYGVPGLDLTQVAIPLEHLSLLPREIASRHGVLPVLVQDERIFLAMSNPDDKRVIDELEFVTGKRVFPYVAPAKALARVIERSYELRLQGEAYFLGPQVPHEVLVKLGIAQPSPTPEPAAPQARRSRPPTPEPAARGPARPPPPRRETARETAREAARMPSVMPPKMESTATSDLTEGDFAGGSELSTVAAVPISASPGALGGPGAAPGQPLVLVVDDEEDIRKLLKRVLLDRNYRVIEADRGTTALRLVKEHVPDLIVLDAMLPELHGFEICRRIKGSQKYGQIPIIMISAVYRGWRYAEDLKQNYGVDAYIEKPFRITEVVRAIETAIASKKGEGQKSSREQISAEADRCLQAGIAAYQSGDIEGAIEHLKRGSSIDPLAYRLHYHLGLVHGKKGQIFEAIQALETAVEINGKHFPALKNLAVLYQKAGFKLKAVEMWERALAHSPDEATRQGIKDHLLTLL
ncbi:MAG: response regulator [Deltaproteobacteria bacterium]|nr:response regulator [Deltaproteobacteria bacterium]